MHGPPGCGKTLLAKAVAGTLEVPVLANTGTELISGISGDSESRIRDLFEQVDSSCSKCSPGAALVDVEICFRPKLRLPASCLLMALR